MPRGLHATPVAGHEPSLVHGLQSRATVRRPRRSVNQPPRGSPIRTQGTFSFLPADRNHISRTRGGGSAGRGGGYVSMPRPRPLRLATSRPTGARSETKRNRRWSIGPHFPRGLDRQGSSSIGIGRCQMVSSPAAKRAASGAHVADPRDRRPNVPDRSEFDRCQW